MKLLVIVSSLDLTQPFSATPAWWQLLKGLYEIGVEVIAIPYQGPAIESLWWRAEPNPGRLAGDAFLATRNIARGLFGRASRGADARPNSDESAADAFIRRSANALIAPLWQRHLDRLLTREPDIDALLFLTVPLNQLTGVPRYLRDKHHKPMIYFDGDVPASLPNMQGFATGFRIYQGADLTEYDAFISNSTGGEHYLRELGARATHTVWYGADPAVYAPRPDTTKDLDAFFFGHGREYRGQWIDAMLNEPANALADAQFAVRGTHLALPARVQQLPYLSFSKLREYITRSRLNLVITRGAHASLYASSSMRPFELGMMGACMVANPYEGIEAWYEPEREIIIVHSAQEAIERYRYLLAHDADRERIAQAAYDRAHQQHTFRQRAHTLRGILAQYIG